MYIKNKLEKAKAYRERQANSLGAMADFASNDYLGLAKTDVENVPLLDGENTRSSRMLFGQHTALSQIEKYAASTFGFESAILFPSGYQANVGLISAFSGRKVVFYCDELIHASMHDGLRLGVNTRYFYEHNNMAQLRSLLSKHSTESDVNIILTEGLFSMDGDYAKQKEIKQLANEFDAKIMIDEAHSAGVFGKTGLGLWHNDKSILAKVVTFGKAFAGEGAVVLCTADTKEFLYQYCRSLIFSTAPSKQFCQQAYKALHKASEDNEARGQLQNNIQLFRKALSQQFVEENRLMGEASSPVQAVLLPPTQLLEIEKKAELQGIALKAIFAPTVAKGQERLRISIHAFNTKKEIAQLCELLNSTI